MPTITETPLPDTFSQSQSVACKIGTVAPDAVFCTFALQGSKKIPFKRSGQGVARDTDPTDLYSSEDIWAMDSCPFGQYLGLVQQRPIISASGNYLVCLDVDMKHASGPTNVAIQRMAKYVKANNMLTEVSVSGRGRHVFLWVKAPPVKDLILPKYKLGGGQELEVFGLPNSAGKSVLLSGNAVAGEFQGAVDLFDLLQEWGIIEQHQLQEPKPAPPSQAFDFTNMLSKGAPDDLSRATQALHFISPDCDYDQWIELGQALHTAFDEQGLGPWMQWSMAGQKFAGTKDIETHWKSFHQGKGVGLGTLFKYAKDCGWEAPTKQTERKSAVEDFAAVISQAQGDAPVATDEAKGWPERQLSIGQIKPIRYMVKGFWAHSFMVLAGQPGIGKTTAVISLCMVMAGIQAKDCELTATKKRKTIIVTEDSDQVERTLTGYARHYGINPKALSDWFVIIDAKRSNVKDLLMLAHNVINHTIDNVRPLLVLDTANATMDIDNENDNSEVGAYIAALKQTIYIQLDTPVCIITHTNKTISKSDSDATARGASAFTGDATLTGVLFEDETKTRYMRLVKTRYQPNFREIKFNSDVFADTVLDEDGDIQEQMVLLVVPAMSSEEDRRQAANDRQNDKKQQQVQDAADAACNFVQSIINAKGAVIMRRGSGRPSVPKEMQSMHQLEWSDIYQAVPTADQSYARRAVSSAIFQRFCQDQSSSGWVQIK
ncbi:AAA domain containing protein [uncultured Caudovirales phage]|uniref:AAA domain containing protein n=1 Tax=uncultured Caudovirales phage TaxID=2100421 RepID=A0A6J5SIU2_9CAUD|nr:AAA domain containing protein [uncultured Caudovirales phage]CAB5229476.1 AAA domain containing protein [uncultured Caudovirales phage]